MKFPQAKALSRVLCTVCFASAMPGLLAGEVTWTAASNGDWSNGSNWSTAPNPPANDGSDLLDFHFTSDAARITGMGADWAVDGIRVSSTPGVSSLSTLTIVAGALSGGNPAMDVSGTLSVGASGLTIAPGGSGQTNLYLGDPTSGSTNHLTVRTTADQFWKTSSNGTGGRIVVSADLAGSGEIYVHSSLAAPNNPTGALTFASGNSDNFTGSFTLMAGQIVLDGSSQVGRLGPNTFTIINANTGSNLSNSELVIQNLANATQTFANDVHFVDASTGKTNTIHIFQPGSSVEDLIWSGDWSGAMATQLIMRQHSRTMIQKFQGDNSGWSSSLASNAINLQSGRYLLENNNALGTNNSISVQLGGANVSSSGLWNYGAAALYAKDGVTVNSRIDASAANKFANVLSLGMLESGTATYAGTILMANSAAGQGSANMHFVTAAGGRVNFTGTIGSSQLGSVNKVPVIVEGGGTVALSGNNTYHGITSVIDGTTLLANSAGGSSTGVGAVYVGLAAANFTGNTTVNSNVIWGLSSTAGLVPGMKISGAGIPAGAFIAWVDGTEIGISALATATASGVSVAGAATTGTLGGTGIVRTGTGGASTAAVLVAAASGIAPGDGGIGTLKFDGVNTSAPLLTMASGAYFSFDLGVSDSSDRVSFWNYAAGDFVLNGNVINFTGAQEGTYTLFDFYSNAGTTAALSGISSGLVIGAGLDGYNYTLNYNASSITLELTMVPEPGTAALIALGGLALAVCGRRRRLPCEPR